jgi:uncharacterized protein
VTTLELLVKPRSKRDRLTLDDDGRLTIAVTAPPVDGRDNEQVVKLLSRSLGVPQRSVTILHGRGGKRKLAGIEGLTGEEIRSRLRAAGA